MIFLVLYDGSMTPAAPQLSRRFLSVLLPLTAFISGAAVLIFEITASRAIGPYLGNSLVTWTSLIGVILLSLSVGNWLGGRLADRTQELRVLSLILLGAGILLLLTNASKSTLLDAIAAWNLDLRLSTVLAAGILLMPVGVVLGMVSPFATRSLLKDVATGGQTIGGMDAMGNIGSIVGTFLAGFVLLPFLGTSAVLNVLAAVILTLSLLIAGARWRLGASLALLVALGSLPLMFYYQDLQAAGGFIDADTSYSRIWIYEGRWVDGRPVEIFQTDKQFSSARYLDTSEPELVFRYNQAFLAASALVPEARRTLLIGGAGYTYPTAYLAAYPNASMDIVEIDPQVTKLAKAHFGFQDDPRVSIFHEDGRTFINTDREGYDVIFIDAYSNLFSIPFQLVSTEAFAELKKLLNPNGIIVTNVISAPVGEKSNVFSAITNTMAQSFSQLAAIPMGGSSNLEEIQNVVIVAAQHPVVDQLNNLTSDALPLVYQPLTSSALILTDEHAPIDYYALSTILR